MGIIDLIADRYKLISQFILPDKIEFLLPFFIYIAIIQYFNNITIVLCRWIYKIFVRVDNFCLVYIFIILLILDYIIQSTITRYYIIFYTHLN